MLLVVSKKSKSDFRYLALILECRSGNVYNISYDKNLICRLLDLSPSRYYALANDSETRIEIND